MRYSRSCMRILAVSLAFLLCLTMFAQSTAFMAGAADAEEGEGSISEGEGDSYDDGDDGDSDSGDGGSDSGDDGGSEPGDADDDANSDDDADADDDDDADDDADADDDEDSDDDADDDDPDADDDEEETELGDEEEETEEGSGSSGGAGGPSDVNILDFLNPEEEEESVAAFAVESMRFSGNLSKYLPNGAENALTDEDLLLGIIVYNEADEDVTDQIDLSVSDYGGLNVEDPEVAIYTLELLAVHEESEVEATGYMKVEIYKVGGDPSITLRGDTINIGATSYVTITADMNTGTREGRYIVLEADDQFGFRFNISGINVGTLTAVETITLLDDRTVLLEITDGYTNIFDLGIPVVQTINSELSPQLREDMSFSFSTRMYADLDGEPAEGDPVVAEDSVVLGLTEYRKSTLFISQSTSDVLRLEGYNTSAVLNTDSFIEQFRLNINKAAGMRSSYGLDVIIPLNAELGKYIDEVEDVYYVEDVWGIGIPCIVLPYENFSDVSALVSSLLDPQDTYTYTGYQFAFTPSFTGLENLAQGSYKADQPIQLRIHQYGEEVYVTLDNDVTVSDFYYELTVYDADPSLNYQFTPREGFIGADDVRVTYSTYYDAYTEPSYDDLVLTFSYPYEIQPQLIELANYYGDANITYTLSGGGSQTEYLAATESLQFNIPAGERVTEIKLEPVYFNAVYTNTRPHFYLTSNYMTQRETSDGFVDLTDGDTANVALKIDSEKFGYHYNVSSYQYRRVTFREDTYNIKNATVAILPQQVYSSANGGYTYYLNNRPEESVNVARLFYGYGQKVGSYQFQFALDFEDTDEVFLKSLSAVDIEPRSSLQYVTEYSVYYSTARGGEKTIGPRTEKDNIYELLEFEFADASDYLTALTVELTVKEWTSSVSTPALVGFYMDLNKYEKVMGEDWPNPTPTLDVAGNFAVVNATEFQSVDVAGTAGNFVNDREPFQIYGNNVEFSMSSSEAQIGDVVTLSINKLLEGYAINTTGSSFVRAQKRVALSGMTTYITLSDGFTYVPDSFQVDVNSRVDYQPGDLSYTVSYTPGSDGSGGSLEIYWHTYTTGIYSSTYAHADDPVLSFQVQVSPFVETDKTHSVIASQGLITSMLEDAFDNNANYAFTVEDGELSHLNATTTYVDSTLRVMPASSYGIELYGGVDSAIYFSTLQVPYYNHQNIQLIVKMNYETTIEGSLEDGVIYIPIPGDNGSHTGLRLAGPVDLGTLPAGSSVAYSTSADPGMAMRYNWDSEDLDYVDADDFTGNYGDVTMVRIIGMDLDQVQRFAYVPLENLQDKAQIYDQDISMECFIRYHKNSDAQKFEVLTWRLTDYTVTGFFFLDDDETGIMTDAKAKLSGMIQAANASSGDSYRIVTVNQTGYTALIPAYGIYDFSVYSPGYKPTKAQADSLFDEDGLQRVAIDGTTMSNGVSMILHAGFVPDDSDMVLVVFLANNDTEDPQPQWRAVGEKVDDPGDPAYVDYEFAGWFEGHADGTVLVPGDGSEAKAWDFDVDTVASEYKGGVMYLVAKWDDAGVTELIVSSIDFGLQSIPYSTTTYPRTDDTVRMDVEVLNAPAGDWHLTVTCASPFTNENGYSLSKDNLIYVDSDGKETMLSDIAVAYVGATGDARNFILSWEHSKGILARVYNGDLIHEGQYVATLQWDVMLGGPV